MKIPTTKKPQPTAGPVDLYVIRNKAGEVVVATFELASANAVAKGRAVETHTAKAMTTGAMYGKLFGLTGVQRRGALKTNSKMTKAQRHERAVTANGARWK